eukprot:4035204-Pyramimonas_sp.AAC.1
MRRRRHEEGGWGKDEEAEEEEEEVLFVLGHHRHEPRELGPVVRHWAICSESSFSWTAAQ